MIKPVVFALNALWFGMGFNAFYLRRAVFAKVLVTNKAHRTNSAYDALVESGRFLGGFNFALSLLNIALIFNFGEYNSDSQWSLMLLFNSAAHGSQFFGNVPIAMENRQGKGVWNVFKGTMFLIFVVDFILMTLNGLIALTLQ
eukprot:m.11925 g.11925  ORF g.11925 m.11925 type:complete len:143 (+) comp4557_c0_seq1:197-625(+)